MDAAQIYLELLECGECLIRALAEERKANSATCLNARNAMKRLRAARWEVEQSAEYYVIALRTYRVALLAEFVPSEAVFPERRSPNRAATAAGSRRGQAAANPDIAGQDSLSRRLSKFQ